MFQKNIRRQLSTNKQMSKLSMFKKYAENPVTLFMCTTGSMVGVFNGTMISYNNYFKEDMWRYRGYIRSIDYLVILTLIDISRTCFLLATTGIIGGGLGFIYPISLPLFIYNYTKKKT